MIQLNTAYPATAYLMGFLRQHEARLGLELAQADPALELFLRLYSKAGLERVVAALSEPSRKKPRKKASAPVASFLGRAAEYVDTVDAAVRFLQGRDPGLALRIVGRSFLPEGPRFAAITPDGDGDGDGDDGSADPLAWAFGDLGVEDRARHLASLFVDD